MYNTNKPFLVFGMPRSGTTLMMSIIKTYSSERFSIYEYFGSHYKVIDDNIKLRTEFIDTDKRLTQSEIIYRIEKLKKYKDKKIPIKILSGHMTNDIFEYIKNEYQCILIERDKYEQLLSWLIAQQTKIWNIEFDQTHIPSTTKFIVDLKDIDIFIDIDIKYSRWKNILQQENIILCNINYKEFSKKDNFKSVVEKIFKYDNRPIIYGVKKLYSLSEKENLIINLNEIKEYMKEINV